MIFLLRDCVIFCGKRLRDFLCEEVASFFMLRGCVIICVKRFFREKIFSGKNSFLVKFFF